MKCITLSSRLWRRSTWCSTFTAKFLRMLLRYACAHCKLGRVLNMSQNIHVLNAEPTFLPHLRKLHARFPRLRIVLEHATTRAAVEAVKSLGDTVACTITAHHLALTVDDWAGQSFHFCKPVAKYPDYRAALRDVVREGSSPGSRCSSGGAGV